MNLGYAGAKEIIETEPFYQECIKKTIGDFPAIDCPEDYKRCICAISGGTNLAEFLKQPLGYFGNRSLLQVLEARDYVELQQWVFETISLAICGPGSY